MCCNTPVYQFPISSFQGGADNLKTKTEFGSKFTWRQKLNFPELKFIKLRMPYIGNLGGDQKFELENLILAHFGYI